MTALISLKHVTTSPLITVRSSLRSAIVPLTQRRGMAFDSDLKRKLQELQQYSACDVCERQMRSSVDLLTW